MILWFVTAENFESNALIRTLSTLTLLVSLLERLSSFNSNKAVVNLSILFLSICFHMLSVVNRINSCLSVNSIMHMSFHIPIYLSFSLTTYYSINWISQHFLHFLVLGWISPKVDLSQGFGS